MRLHAHKAVLRDVCVVSPEKRILLIDHEFQSLAFCRLVLQLAGYAVVAVTRARHGLEILRSQSFDLVLLGKHLPDLESDALAQQIRLFRPGLPLVAMGAAGADPASVADAMVETLASPQLLIKAVEQALRGQQPAPAAGHRANPAYRSGNSLRK